MQTDKIDYSNTIFYKIFCKDTSVKDIYIGHTTNFVQRKYCHRRTCNTEKCDNHNLKVYKYIRNNGGWTNWRMDIIGFHECNDHYEARKVEQDYFETLHATLNSIEPMSKPKPIPKEKHHRNIKQSVSTVTPLQDMQNESPKFAKQFYYEPCNFKCSKQSNFDVHLLTRKHERLTNTSETATKNADYICDCGKVYKHRQSLHVHKKKCKHKEPSSETALLTGPTMQYLLKEYLLK